MAVNATNARIFGSDNDAVNIAPLGTTLPTTLAALAAPFVDAGWLGPDGISFSPEDSITKHRGHQGNRVVRTTVTESGMTFTFQCLETTALTLGLQHRIKSATTTTGVTRRVVAPSRRIDPRAFVIDVFDKDDATIQDRYVVARGEIGERSEFTLSNTDITGFTFTVEIIGDFDHITNNPALAVV